MKNQLLGLQQHNENSRKSFKIEFLRYQFSETMKLKIS